MQQPITPTRGPDESMLQLLHVLILVQGSITLLSGVAMLLFMGGNPAALPLTIGLPLFLFVLAAGVVRGWRWARKATVVVQALILAALAFSMLVGLIPALGFSLNLLTLMTNVGMPVAIIKLVRATAPVTVTASRPIPEALPETLVAA